MADFFKYNVEFLVKRYRVPCAVQAPVDDKQYNISSTVK
jgi:hypothetical protein